ncbi:hypothetical protein AMECASPLE_020668, partial [Ameca splendens]
TSETEAQRTWRQHGAGSENLRQQAAGSGTLRRHRKVEALARPPEEGVEVSWPQGPGSGTPGQCSTNLCTGARHWAHLADALVHAVMLVISPGPGESHDFIGEFTTSYRELSRGQSQFNVYEVKYSRT